jgi:hypothetical protein
LVQPEKLLSTALATAPTVARLLELVYDPVVERLDGIHASALLVRLAALVDGGGSGDDEEDVATAVSAALPAAGTGDGGSDPGTAAAALWALARLLTQVPDAVRPALASAAAEGGGGGAAAIARLAAATTDNGGLVASLGWPRAAMTLWALGKLSAVAPLPPKVESQLLEGVAAALERVAVAEEEEAKEAGGDGDDDNEASCSPRDLALTLYGASLMLLSRRRQKHQEQLRGAAVARAWRRAADATAFFAPASTSSSSSSGGSVVASTPRDAAMALWALAALRRAGVDSDNNADADANDDDEARKWLALSALPALQRRLASFDSDDVAASGGPSRAAQALATAGWSVSRLLAPSARQRRLLQRRPATLLPAGWLAAYASAAGTAAAAAGEHDDSRDNANEGARAAATSLVAIARLQALDALTPQQPQATAPSSSSLAPRPQRPSETAAALAQWLPHLLVRASASGLARLPPAELAGAAYAAAALAGRAPGPSGAAARERFARALATAVEARLTALSPGQLASSVWAMAALQAPVTKKLYASALAALRPALPKLSAAAAAATPGGGSGGGAAGALAWAVATLSSTGGAGEPPQGFVGALLDALMAPVPRGGDLLGKAAEADGVQAATEAANLLFCASTADADGTEAWLAAFFEEAARGADRERKEEEESKKAKGGALGGAAVAMGAAIARYAALTRVLEALERVQASDLRRGFLAFSGGGIGGDGEEGEEDEEEKGGGGGGFGGIGAALDEVLFSHGRRGGRR